VRLKIIDLDHGRQPMLSDDGDTVLVFNGEIYNSAEIRRELEQRGHSFDSRCDTETLLRAFLEWDVDAFSRLRGMFAAALWTESQRRLVLVRDRLGIKPLYFARRGSNLYFGSELKTILLHPEIERRIDPEALDHYLSLNYVPGPRTLVEGVEKLPPGQWLEWRDGRVHTETYWKLDFKPDTRLDLESAKDELDYLLRSSVREHLVSDVPWAYGPAAASIRPPCCTMRPKRPNIGSRLFPFRSPGRSFDESRYFRQVADYYQTDHHEFDLNPRPICRAPSKSSHTIPTNRAPTPVPYRSGFCRRCAAAKLPSRFRATARMRFSAATTLIWPIVTRAGCAWFRARSVSSSPV
jgi:asparagine synthase (glutamine-hydrolysing)